MMRMKFLYWLYDKYCIEGEILPKWLQLLRWTLLPIKTYNETIASKIYNMLTNTYCLSGVMVSAKLFDFIKDHPGLYFIKYSKNDGMTFSHFKK